MHEKFKTVGVDAQQLGDRYIAVLTTAHRLAPSVLVICNVNLGSEDYAFAIKTFQAGMSVHLVDKRDLAPPDTEWLSEPVP